MAIPVVEFSREGYKIRKVFGKKSTYPKEIIESRELDFGVISRCQNLGIISENTVLLHFYSSIRKIPMIFDIEN